MAPTEELGFRQYLLRVTLAKIDFWSEVLPQCILQLLSKKTFSSSELRLRGFLSYPSSSSTFTTLIAHINSRVASVHLAGVDSVVLSTVPPIQVILILN